MKSGKETRRRLLDLRKGDYWILEKERRQEDR